MLGLGRFDVELGHRRKGLILVRHSASPFADASGGSAPGCALVAGLHAGLLSHLAGRRLAGREIACSSGPDQPCRFVVATESRLERLFDPGEGSADEGLLARLGVRGVETAAAS